MGPWRVLLALGLALALWRIVVPLLPLGDGLDYARAAGLWSATVRAGYDDGQEARAFFLLLLLCTLSLGALAGDRLPAVARGEDARRSWMIAGAIGGVMALLSLRPLAAPSLWGTFGLLGEEGVYLGALEAMRHGRQPWVDLHFPYGPLLLLPPFVLQKAGLESVLALRGLALVEHGAGLWILATVGARLARVPRLVLLAAAFALWPFVLPALNGVALRPALALLPVLVAIGPNRTLGLLAGALCAVAGGFSPELAVPAALGATVARGRALGGRALVELVVGAVAGAVLVLALCAFLAPPLRWPRAAWADVRNNLLGFQALPFPDVVGIFRDEMGRVRPYPPGSAQDGLWASVPPLLLACSVAAAFVRRLALPMGLGLCCALLYRAPLGRSDLSHLWVGAVPSLIVLAPWWITQLTPLASWARPLLVTAPALLLAASRPWTAIAFPADYDAVLDARAGIPDGAPPTLLKGPRGGVQVGARAGVAIQGVLDRVAAIPPEDRVFFWPNESALYHLSGRPLPWPYLWAWDAATPGMEQRGLDDLRARPPTFVLTLDEQAPFDEISQYEATPRVQRWIDEHYVPVESHPGFTLLRYRP